MLASVCAALASATADRGRVSLRAAGWSSSCKPTAGAALLSRRVMAAGAGAGGRLAFFTLPLDRLR
ncbi:MAG: hypothetical protein MZU91_07360 [Desulfosudis oleivorans]|nr:hypothetical protein [Desulfosudis oleivorans]